MEPLRTTTTLGTQFTHALSAAAPAALQVMSLMALAIAGMLLLLTAAWADPFDFSTGTPDGLLGALSQPPLGETLETTRE